MWLLSCEIHVEQSGTPRWFRASLRQAFLVSIQEWHRTKSREAWVLFLLTPRLLLQPTAEQGDTGKNIFEDRFQKFMRGDWTDLLKASRQQAKVFEVTEDEEAAKTRRRKGAESKVRMREISKARLHLTSDGIAPGSEETLNQLRDPTLRPFYIGPCREGSIRFRIQSIDDEIWNSSPPQKLS